MPIDPSRESKVAALFDALAPTYDNTGVEFFQPIADGLIAAIAPREGEALLDVGCGRGAVLLPAARLVSPGRAVGIDISPAMVELAKAEATDQGLANVEVHVADADRPAVTGAPFDVITASLVLFFLADPIGALRSWLGLLGAGGRVGVTTFGPVDERWMHVDEVLLPFLPDKDARTAGAAGPFASDGGVEGMLTDAGFVRARSTHQRVDVRFDSPDQWLSFSMSTGQRAAWMRVPEEQRSSVREEAMGRFIGFCGSDGGVTFTQEVRHSLGHHPDA